MNSQQLREYPLPENFLVGFVKMSQITLVMAGGPYPWTPWPATPMIIAISLHYLAFCKELLK